MTNLFHTAEAEGFGGLEDLLSNLIEPVNPDPKFVETLRLKLANAPAVILDTGNKNLPLLAAAAGLTAGILIYWLLKRKDNPAD